MVFAACWLTLSLLIHVTIQFEQLDVAAAGNVQTSSTTFRTFVEKFGRKYRPGSPEYEARRDLFERRLDKVKETNSRPGPRLWLAGINEFSDWTEEELKQLRGWRGVVSSTQGSSAGIIGRHAGGQPSAFLQQTGGCDGATVELAMHYAMNSGVADESVIPYEEVTGMCPHPLSSAGRWALLQSKLKAAFIGNDELSQQQSISDPGVHMAASPDTPGRAFGMMGWERLPENEYEPLIRAVVERGPVAVSAAASEWSSYMEGIFDHCHKDQVIDHAVVLLGYGKDMTLAEKYKDTTLVQKYWLIQNSWGVEWGEHGRIRVLRQDADNIECGSDYRPEVGTGCEGGPKKVKVCGMCGLLYDAVVPHFRTSK